MPGTIHPQCKSVTIRDQVLRAGIFGPSSCHKTRRCHMQHTTEICTLYNASRFTRSIIGAPKGYNKNRRQSVGLALGNRPEIPYVSLSGLTRSHSQTGKPDVRCEILIRNDSSVSNSQGSRSSASSGRWSEASGSSITCTLRTLTPLEAPIKI